jgi:hypothetical protein
MLLNAPRFVKAVSLHDAILWSERNLSLGPHLDATEQLEALDVGVKVDQEIPAQSLLLVLIEMETLNQVIPGQVEDLQPH